MAGSQGMTLDIFAVPAPAARRDGLVVSEVEDEVLVYDQERNHIHHLNRTAATVWRLCDGQRGVTDLVRLARPELGAAVDADVIRLALDELEHANLLDRPLAPDIHVPVHTRREILRRLTVAGGVALAASVASLSVANAQSECTGTCPDSCTGGSLCQCQDGMCTSSG